MAKYIGTYENSGAVQTAINELELSRPFVVYTTDDNKVILGAAGDKAETGDIVVYSTADELLHYIKQAEYSASTYPVADYVPVGVVALPQDDDVFSGASGEITFMGLNWLDVRYPDTGVKRNGNNVGQGAWGYNFDIPELTNYVNSGTAITDMNGKANTEVVLNYATAQTDWRTASAITNTNEEGIYPLFECAWRYHTSGTVQGDWYVPALGQVYFLYNNTTALSQLNSANTILGVGDYAFTGSTGTNIGSSTEQSAGAAWNWWGKSNFRETSKMFSTDFSTRPFCSKLMTRI